MKVFCLSDPHLGFAVNKPMDIYGPLWKDHPEQIRQHWTSCVNPEDIVIVPGDISWASNAEQVKPDMAFFAELPGTIIFGKGNHENWWSSYRKASALIPDNAYLLDATHPYLKNDLAIVGTRMWDNTSLSFAPYIDFNEGTGPEDVEPRDTEAADKIFNRELNRLKTALSHFGDCSKRIVALHYPPTTPAFEKTVVTDMISASGAQACVFGHIHSLKEDVDFKGLIDDVSYYCCSADHIQFKPVEICSL